MKGEIKLDKKHEILQRVFGYTEFRQGQQELINAQLSSRDVLGIMPTGGGKSLCYQIPALLQSGVTLVISPLISLMKDQVAALNDAGVRAAYINSSLTYGQTNLVYRYAYENTYKIIYVAPERLTTEGFKNLCQKIRISQVVVDEAHCISQWGQDFRPSYLKIVEFLELLPYRPVVSAFTATATTQVRKDIIKILKLNNPLMVVTGFDRPNLRFEVKAPESKTAILRTLIENRKNKCGIVYCSTRKEVERICGFLCSEGFNATRYHAGLEEDERRENQDAFIYDKKQIMVATNAFGMGIDKSNVSYVIHFNMPQSLEAYYQEAGRAGRDGSKAECILLFAKKDIKTAEFLIKTKTENEELTPEQCARLIARDMKRLSIMTDYCTTTRCLRKFIMDYFGQEAKSACGNCSNCSSTFDKVEITTESKMILSCVKRIENHLGYSMGLTTLLNVLKGSEEQKILDLRLNTLSTYGLMRDTRRREIRLMAESLMEQGYIVTNSHEAITLSAAASRVLFKGEQVFIYKKRETKPEKSKAVIRDLDEGLFETLKNLRLSIALKENKPAYIIFSNATLQDMATKKPLTFDEFLTVSGVGRFKAERYAKEFIKEIKAYETAKSTD